jgi:hypothetical protein
VNTVRLLFLVTLSACGSAVLEPEREHCLYSLECELSERCIQQRCVRTDAGTSVDAGPNCDDPDSDGAHTTGLVVQNEEQQLDRHVCPGSPDRYRHQLTTATQLQAWVVAESGPAPVLFAVDAESDLPDDCTQNTPQCAQGGRLSGLSVERIERSFDLAVKAPEDRLSGYELGMRVGRPCSEQSDCGSSARCVRAVAERTDQVGTSGICVFSRDLPIDPDCDRNDRSSEHPESAQNAGDFADLELQQVPLCQHDNDWYQVTVSTTSDVSKTVRMVSTAAEAGQLSGVTLFVGLYSATDLRPLRFALLYFAAGAQSQTLSMTNISAGDYKLRVTQINKRSGPITYSLSPP